MKAKEHPEYTLEEKKLKETIQRLQSEIKATDPPKEAYAADQRAAIEVWRQKEARVNRLKDIRKELYIGRVDWKSDEQNAPETFYLGKFADPELGIYSWRETLPARLFYEGRCDEDGTLLLSRKLTIHREQLGDISDDVLHPKRRELLRLSQVAVAQTATGSVDKLLIQLLDQHREGRMHDIVATIQEEQFRLIRSPLKQVLVVQGVPGSGKTAIALHRLSYLLYQHEKSGELSRARVVYLGPNPLFLSYVAPVLPELGERNIAQVAFDDWMQRQIGLDAAYENEEDALEELLDGDKPLHLRVMRYRNARHKGSIQMARLLERYIDHLVDQMAVELGSLSVDIVLGTARTVDERPPSVTVALSQAEIQKLITNARRQQGQQLPFNTLKERVQPMLVQTIVREVQEQGQYSVIAKSITQSQLDGQRERIAQQVSREVDLYLRPWETLNVLNVYRRLLRSSDLLQQLGRDLFDPWSLELLHIDAPKQTTKFRFSDLGALLYLAFLLNGAPNATTFDHVVIDEAQDMTPLQYEVLKRWSRNQSFTIMGDMAQSIYSDHGLRSWQELTQIFDHSQVSQHTVRQSYRSTKPIIDYGNQLLARCGVAQEQLAIPLARTGEAPLEIDFGGTAYRGAKLRNLIGREQAQGRKSIAILVKTAHATHQLAKELSNSGITDFQLIDKRTMRYNDGLAVLPIYLAKGLEFDTVVIADASADTYSTLTLDARLLYVAITRASHKLCVGWIGKITPLLDAATYPRIELQDFYEQQLAPQPATIEEYVRQVPTKLDADTLVERVASANKLHLLVKGRIDQALLSVLADGWRSQVGDDEMLAPELDPQLEHAIRTQVQQLLERNDPAATRSIVFVQLSYGLLRNVLRGAGIAVTEQEDANPQTQAVALAQFLNAIRTLGLSYSAGSVTTERRVLQAVYEGWHTPAQQILHLLIVHGIVEAFAQNQGRRIRVVYDWIERLLRAALGHEVEELDADLRTQLPLLAHPISQQVIAPSDLPRATLEVSR